MAKVNIAVIGGSGIYKLDSIKIKDQKSVETPFGAPSADIMVAEISGHQFYFLPRHGHGHSINPSQVNYAANIFALKKLGVDTIVSISAVGSLDEDIEPESFVFVDQFLDWTKGMRRRSFFDNGLVGHISVADPVSSQLQESLFKVSNQLDIKSHKNGCYVCIEGPQFSTRFESKFFKSMGASVIGMTNVPEAYLAKEAGMSYSTVALVTDFDGWKEEHCTVDEIMKVMKNNYISAQKFVSHAIPELYKNPIAPPMDHRNAVITDESHFNEQHRKILATLMS